MQHQKISAGCANGFPSLSTVRIMIFIFLIYSSLLKEVLCNNLIVFINLNLGKYMLNIMVVTRPFGLNSSLIRMKVNLILSADFGQSPLKKPKA